MGRLLISEEEKNYIKSLYNLTILKEQTEPPTPTSSDELTIEKKIDFPAGYYNVSYLEPLKPELDKIKNFLSSNPNTSYVVSLNIKSGESKIPNTDNESPAKEPLPQGELSKRRAESITKYVKDYWGSVGITNTDLIPGPVNAVIGETEWVGQDFCPSNSLKSGDEIGRDCLNRNFNPKNGKPNWVNGKDNIYKEFKSKYDTEQFVYITIKVDKDQPSLEPCLDGMEIQLNYEEGNHYCNSSVYELYINGNLLYRDGDNRPYASLNNGIKPEKFKGKNKLGKDKVFTQSDIEYYDNSITSSTSIPDYAGKRYNTFTISTELAKNLSSTGGDVFEITAICRNPTNQTNWNGGCHKDVSQIVIINGLGVTEKYNISTPNKRDETKLLVTIDACGKKISM
jgi:hypothetical protein